MNENQIKNDSAQLGFEGVEKKQILTFSEACNYIGRSKSFLYKLTSQRKIPHYVPTGKVIYFLKTDLDSWMTTNRRKTISEIENE